MAEVLAVVVPLYVLILLGLLASKAKAFRKGDLGLKSI